MARRMLFDVFAHSFFNPEAEMSAAELLTMFRFYFTANPKGLLFDVLDDAFGPALVDPWSAWLTARGVTLATSRAALSVGRSDDGAFVVETSTEPLRADAVVIATEVPGLHALCRESPLLAVADGRGSTLAERLLALSVTAPFAVWRLILDRQPRPERAPFAGTSGMGRLDNISIYERLEAEARDYAHRSGHSVIELHAYGLDITNETALKRELRGGLEELYPELAGARVIHDEYLLRQDCPAFPPGSFRGRPRVATPIPRLALAGDYVQLPFASALMERAAASGVLAAHTVLAPSAAR
jgi:isorenieratene synthase